MKKYSEQEFDNLQSNLKIIRKAGRWTTAEFGEMIGVTKQTISNLENKNTKLTKTQYIAIRSVLDYEIESNPENTILKDVVNLTLNSDDLDKSEREKALEAASIVSSIESTGNAIDKAKVLAIVGAIATAALPLLDIGISAGSRWLSKLKK